jgi:radical SAM-linked protein
MKVRIKFRKTGAVRYIGHLDVMRYFQKLIRRAGIDVAYSSGFAPHQIMSFAAPLSVGMESNGEYMDIEVHQVTNCNQMRNAMNQATIEGIEIMSCTILPDRAENAMSSVAAASYQVRLQEKVNLNKTELNNAELDKAAICHVLEQRFISQDSIPIQKKTKKGFRDMDLKPGVFSFSIMQGGEAIQLLTDASSAGNVKPKLLMEALCQEPVAGFHYPDDFGFQFIREDMYTNTPDGFISLDQIGDSHDV